MANQLTVAALQCEVTQGDVAQNLSDLEAQLELLCQQEPGLDLVVLPEVVNTGFVLEQQAHDLAEPQDGFSFQALSNLCAKHKLHLVYGYIERSEDGKVYDSQAVISDQGELLGNYRKLHLTEFETSTYVAGEQITTVDTRLGKLGLLICWDMAFPELSRLQALAGCDLLIASCAWEKPHGETMHRFATARAMDNTLPLVVSNLAGSHAGFEFSGYSGVIGSDGNSLELLGDAPGAAVATLNLDEQRQRRQEFFSMMDERRRDVYQLAQV